jgi:hypothetical protein
VKRREFITLLGGAAGGWPFVARAQQGERMRRIGVMATLAESDPVGQAYMVAFRQGLQALGWSEGRNLQLDIRQATTDAELIERSAKEPRRAAARPHSDGKHTDHGGTAKTYERHPHPFRERFRSNRLRLCRELIATRWQHHRVPYL